MVPDPISAVFATSDIADVAADFRAESLRQPFSQIELARLTWGLPSFGIALLFSSLPDYGKVDLEPRLWSSYQARISAKADTVRFGDLIVAPKEIDALAASGRYRRSIFSRITNLVVDSNELLLNVTRFRIRATTDLLDARLRMARSGGPASSIADIDVFGTGQLKDTVRYETFGLIMTLAVSANRLLDDKMAVGFMKALTSRLQNRFDDAMQGEKGT